MKIITNRFIGCVFIFLTLPNCFTLPDSYSENVFSPVHKRGYLEGDNFVETLFNLAGFFINGSPSNSYGIPISQILEKQSLDDYERRKYEQSVQIKIYLIKNSIKNYSGNCPCPYSTDRAGRRCGGRSAWSRAGGASPLCYGKDISQQAVNEIRQKI